MIREENWAVDPVRVRSFFAAQPGASETADGFFLDGCRVTLTAVPGTLLGKWAMTRTLLRLEGDEEAVCRVYRQFFLRFLSAGG